MSLTSIDARGFADLGVPAPITQALAESAITTPFPIQSATLPDSLAGRDVLGRGRTGSGKTVAFAVPAVAVLASSERRRNRGRPRALILVPTRELAGQVASTVKPLARAMGLRTATVYGGVSQVPQVKALRDGVDIVVACPGRLEDLIGQGHCRLDEVEVTVLDEADHMADLGFLPSVKRLLDQTPQEGQRLLFSATLDNGVDVLVRRYLRDPVTHAVDEVEAPITTMTHHVLDVRQADKAAVVRELASGEGRTLLFTRTKHAARKLAGVLTKAGIPAVDLHGNLSQAARQRNMDAFAQGRARVLVATDIAARGIHVDDVRLVVHVDPPAEPKAFMHRSGRTARAGADGTVVTIATPEQAKAVRTLARQAGVRPRTTTVEPGHALIGELAGPAAQPVAAAPAAAVAVEAHPRAQQPARRAGRGAGRTGRGGPERDGRLSSRGSAPRRRREGRGARRERA